MANNYTHMYKTATSSKLQNAVQFSEKLEQL